MTDAQLTYEQVVELLFNSPVDINGVTISIEELDADQWGAISNSASQMELKVASENCIPEI